jgi:hypothetical protein
MQIVTDLRALKRGQVVQLRGLVGDILDNDGNICVKAMPMLLTVLDDAEVGPSSGNFIPLEKANA